MNPHLARALVCAMAILLSGCIEMDMRPSRPPVPYAQAKSRLLGNIRAAAQAEAPPGSKVSVQLTEGKYVDTSGWVLFRCTVKVVLPQAAGDGADDGLNDRLTDRIGSVIEGDMANDQAHTRSLTLDVTVPPKPKPAVAEPTGEAAPSATPDPDPAPAAP